MANSTPAQVESGYFTRQSSGLVRGISLSSAVVLNLSFVGLVQAILAATLIPSSFPGASPVLAVLVAVIALLSPYLMYGLFTRLMPRSGGDYVFVSRSLGPWAGLAASVNVTLWYIAAVAYLTFVIPQTALPSAFGSIGVIADSQWFTDASATILEDNWTFLIAGALDPADLHLFHRQARLDAARGARAVRAGGARHPRFDHRAPAQQP